MVSQCKEKKTRCQPSGKDCSTLYYSCEPGQEVCGCNRITYNCPTEAECAGMADYTKGKCE
jgi:hypothetical protein